MKNNIHIDLDKIIGVRSLIESNKDLDFVNSNKFIIELIEYCEFPASINPNHEKSDLKLVGHRLENDLLTIIELRKVCDLGYTFRYYSAKGKNKTGPTKTIDKVTLIQKLINREI